MFYLHSVQPGPERSAKRLLIAATRAIGLVAWAALLGGCDISLGLGGDESNKLSPRVVQLGEPVPKGGGVYKVGSPYRINGTRYVPREVDHYDKKGVASWYGELFHGRYTANREIYDMEALTAAHPTLPLPSYVRVTNLRNSRSLVVRVNDRGPYRHNRIIDLSWAVASLLRMERAGTAPVRVQYLGPAPLNGDDHYERSILAQQPWAGPRIAYAHSPAKAYRARGTRLASAPASSNQAVNRQQKTASVVPASYRQETPPSRAAARPTRLSRSMPVADASRLRRKDEPRTNINMRRNEPRAPTTRGREQPYRQRMETAHSRQAIPIQQRASDRSFFYIDAGMFEERRLAEALADELDGLAPTSIQIVSRGNRPVHRIWLGPFRRRDAADDAAQRLRAAGLTAARVENAVDG